MSVHEPQEDAFGFGSLAATAKDRIKQIKPTSASEPTADLARIDAVADNAGFVSREAPGLHSVYRSTASARPEPRSAINMRVPVSLAGAFQRFCEENRYSYPEALAEIMKRAGLETK
jgi:hypothetical protein